jgi:hemoglobin
MSESTKASLYDQLGGRETLQRVHRIFYDKIYADAWIGQFFKHIDQTTIENQQTDFMAQAMGGPQAYFGAFPIPAHKHMNIGNELFDLRHGMLRDSLKEAEIPPELADKWLKIDGAFRTGIVKKSMDDCEKRFYTDTIVSFEKPWNY